MRNPRQSPNLSQATQSLDLEKVVQEIVLRSNLKAALQPTDVRRVMNSYLEPEEASAKPWETWL